MELLRALTEAKLHSRIHFQGLDISVEVPADGYRRGVNKKTGESWAVKVPAHYGYIRGTHSPDGEHLDCYLRKSPNKNAKVYVVHQLTVDGSKFDEDKVMLGYDSQREAIAAFKEVTFKPKEMFGGCTEFEMEHFQVMAFSASNSTAILTNDKTYQDFKKRKLLKSGIKSPLMVAMSVSESLEIGLEEISEVLINFNVEEADDEFNADLEYDGPIISYDDQDTAARAIRFAGEHKLSVEYGETPQDIVFIDSEDFESFLELIDIHGKSELAGNMIDAINPVHRESSEVNMIDLEDSFLEEELAMEDNNFSVVVHTQEMKNIGSQETPSWATAGTKVRLVQEGFSTWGEARAMAARVGAGEIPIELEEGSYVLGIDVMPTGDYRYLHEETVEEIVDEEDIADDVFFAQQIQETSRLAGIRTGTVETTGTPSVHSLREKLAALQEDFDSELEKIVKDTEDPPEQLTMGQEAHALRVIRATAKRYPNRNLLDIMLVVSEKVLGSKDFLPDILEAAKFEYGSLKIFKQTMGREDEED